MKGWKTWVAAAIGIVAAGLAAKGHEAASQVLLAVATALGLVGIGHKVEKNAAGK